MERATISQLKNHLSAYLDKVRAGESVLVLDRDRPVARLEAVAPSPGADERLVELERQGLLRRGRASLSLDELRAPAPRASASVVAALLEEREEGR